MSLFIKISALWSRAKTDKWRSNLKRNINNVVHLMNPIANVFKHYATKFESRFPKTFQVVSQLRKGTTMFTKQSLQYAKLRYQIMRKPDAIEKYTWREIELCHQLPRDLRKMSPLLILSIIPAAIYFALPFAYMYPDKLLCRHFWNIEQQLKFGENECLKRRRAYLPLYNDFGKFAESKLSGKEKYLVTDLVTKLKNGSYVSVDEVISLKPIFSNKSFYLESLNRTYLNNLMILNDCYRLINTNPEKKLHSQAFWLAESDKRLLQENLEGFHPRWIYSLSFDRGINARSHSHAELVGYLKIWLKLSNDLTPWRSKENTFLYLHAKALMANSYEPRKALIN